MGATYAVVMGMVNRLLAPAAALAGFDALARGALTLDLGVGRRTRPLGPIELVMAAPRNTVFDVIASPYLGKTPRAMSSKLEVLERGSDMVLAAHYTQVGSRTTTTFETVRFERPERVAFRVVRGPVPHVVERYELVERDDGTLLRYTGELGTDLWALGAWWGDRVAGPWERTVASSLAEIKDEAERRASR
jgi:Polyketide cyclase / dehydrase and lipid transport